MPGPSAAVKSKNAIIHPECVRGFVELPGVAGNVIGFLMMLRQRCTIMLAHGIDAVTIGMSDGFTRVMQTLIVQFWFHISGQRFAPCQLRSISLETLCMHPTCLFAVVL